MYPRKLTKVEPNLGMQVEGSVYTVDDLVTSLTVTLVRPVFSVEELANLLGAVTDMYMQTVFIDFKIGPIEAQRPSISMLPIQKEAKIIVLFKRPEGEIFNQILRTIIERDSSYPLVFIRGTTDEVFTGIQTALLENKVEIYDSYIEALKACFKPEEYLGQMNEASREAANRLD